MEIDLISKKTRAEFREYFVGKTLREITTEFDAADIPCDADFLPNISGQRRTLVEQYYHAVDFTNPVDVRRILVVFGNALADLQQQTEQSPAWGNGEAAKKQFSSLSKWLERDGYRYEQGSVVPVAGGAQIQEVGQVAMRFDVPELRRQIERMRNAVEDDPSLAIGTAKELVETTCKTILRERKAEVKADIDVVELVKETRKVLGLLPEDVSHAARGADTIRRLLSNLATIAHGLSELRNLYGTGHGRDGKVQGLGPRHARLAVGAAAVLATFLLETHEDRTPRVATGNGSK